MKHGNTRITSTPPKSTGRFWQLEFMLHRKRHRLRKTGSRTSHYGPFSLPFLRSATASGHQLAKVLTHSQLGPNQHKGDCLMEVTLWK